MCCFSYRFLPREHEASGSGVTERARTVAGRDAGARSAHTHLRRLPDSHHFGCLRIFLCLKGDGAPREGNVRRL